MITQSQIQDGWPTLFLMIVMKNVFWLHKSILVMPYRFLNLSFLGKYIVNSIQMWILRFESIFHRQTFDSTQFEPYFSSILYVCQVLGASGQFNTVMQLQVLYSLLRCWMSSYTEMFSNNLTKHECATKSKLNVFPTQLALSHHPKSRRPLECYDSECDGEKVELEREHSIGWSLLKYLSFTNVV